LSIVAIKSRHTTDANRFAQQKSSDRSLILVDQAATIETFSVELTIGSVWSERYARAANEMIAIPEEGVKLGAGKSLVVEVSELIGVPHNLYGLVIPTGSLFLDQSIIIAAAKIEPSFNDRLKLRLVNVSGERRVIKSGQKVASALFFSTDVTLFHAESHKGTKKVAHGPLFAERSLAWMKANWPQVITWVIAILCSSVTAFYLGRSSGNGSATPEQSAAPSPAVLGNAAGKNH